MSNWISNGILVLEPLIQAIRFSYFMPFLKLRVIMSQFGDSGAMKRYRIVAIVPRKLMIFSNSTMSLVQNKATMPNTARVLQSNALMVVEARPL